MRWKLLGAAVMALGLIVFSRQRWDEAGKAQSENDSDVGNPGTTAFTSNPAATSPEALQYKSKLRPLTHRKPTREETIELLKTTIIPVADFKDLKFSETLAELNRLSSEAGISPSLLKFVRGEPDVFPNDYLELKMDEVRVRNIPLSNLLRYLLGRSKIVYTVGEGIVEFRDIHAPPDLQEMVPSNLPAKAPSDSPDPFAP